MLLCGALAGFGGACAATQGAKFTGSDGAGGSGVTSSNGGSTSTSTSTTTTGMGGALNISVASSGGSTSSGDPGDACAAAATQATLVTEPVDIILALDNSGSMADELQAVEDNINNNFAMILDTSGVDYRVILISRHRKVARAASGESSTSICVQAPLSGVPMCPPPGSTLTVPKPIFGPRFFQFNDKIESQTSFWRIVNDYDTPDSQPNASTTTGLAPNGWHVWLRPNAKRVFLELSDDDPSSNPTAAMIATDNDFIQQLTAKDPSFGTYNAADPTMSVLNFTWHSIIGLPEKPTPTDPYLPTDPVKLGKCTGNGDSVANGGPTYQDLSIRSGGLRFPICQFTGYDVVFKTIANDVISKTTVSCDFAIPPPPPGKTLDLTKVAVVYTPGNGMGDSKYLQVTDPSKCDASTFYIQNGQVHLCPIPCATVQADGKAKVDVSFECQSTIVTPK
jgi:hypothetical protein